MTISICIPTYNRWMQLRLSLLRYEKISRKPDEIVVCDDGSIDGTTDNLHRLVESGYSIPVRCFYLNSPEYGCSSRPRNVAIRNATSELVFDTASDMFPLGLTLLENIERMCLEWNTLIVAQNTFFMGGQYPLDDGFLDVAANDVAKNSHAGYGVVNGDPESDVFLHTIGHLPSYIYKRQWLLDIGGYDESFSGWGSDDFDAVTRIGNLLISKGFEFTNEQRSLYGEMSVMPSNSMVHLWHERGDRVYLGQNLGNREKQVRNTAGNSFFLDQPNWGTLTDGEKELNYKMGINPETGVFL